MFSRRLPRVGGSAPCRVATGNHATVEPLRLCFTSTALATKDVESEADHGTTFLVDAHRQCGGGEKAFIAHRTLASPSQQTVAGCRATPGRIARRRRRPTP